MFTVRHGPSQCISGSGERETVLCRSNVQHACLFAKAQFSVMTPWVYEDDEEEEKEQEGNAQTRKRAEGTIKART